MNMLDPRHLIFPNFLLDPAIAKSLLASAPSLEKQLSVGGGKMPSSLSGSFRISDLLEPTQTQLTPTSSDDKANTSGENDSLSRPESSFSHGSGGRHSPSPSGGAGSPLGSCKKARKARTIFTDKQLSELESTFEKQKYLSVQDRMELAHRMGLTDTQVKTWYQNRRTKWKRQAAVGMDLLNEAGNMAAVQHLLRTNPYWASYLGAQTPGAAAAAAAPRPFMTPLGMPFPTAGIQTMPGAGGLPAGFLHQMPPFLSMIPGLGPLPKLSSPDESKREESEVGDDSKE